MELSLENLYVDLGVKGLQNFSDSDPPPGGEYVQQHRSETKEKHLYAEVMCCAPTTTSRI